MRIPIKKLQGGFEMPVFGLGTWQMGGRFVRSFLNDDKADINAVKTALDLGITHIDTAELYANGQAEKLVGKAIKGYDRKKLFIVSKVSPQHFRRNRLIKSCEDSLKRLGVDYLDLYLLHAPNPFIPIADTMSGMDELKKKNFIKNIGVSNFTKERLADCQKHTKNKIVANQVHYNLIFREPEKTTLLKYCQENDVMLIAWRPVEKGKLSDKNIPLISQICAKYKKTPIQIAINFLISQKNVVTLAKSTKIEHLRENLGAVGWNMEKDDVERLRKEFADQESVSNAVPLS